MTHEDTGQKSLSLGLGLGVGFAFGVISALMVSPLSGGQMRQRFIDIVAEVKDSAEEIIADMTSVIEGVIEKTETLISNEEEPLKRKIQQFRDELDQLNINEA